MAARNNNVPIGNPTGPISTNNNNGSAPRCGGSEEGSPRARLVPASGTFLTSPGIQMSANSFNYDRRASVTSTGSRLLTVGDTPSPRSVIVRTGAVSPKSSTGSVAQSICPPPTSTPVRRPTQTSTSLAAATQLTAGTLPTLPTHPHAADRRQQKQKQLALSPPSLHISFDVAEPTDYDKGGVHRDLMPQSVSTDNFMPYENRSSSSSGGVVISGERKVRYTYNTRTPPPILKRLCAIKKTKLRSLDQQQDLAEISANYMRVSGAFHPFRGILSAPEKSAAFRKSKTVSQSTENDSVQIQICDAITKSTRADRKSVLSRRTSSVDAGRGADGGSDLMASAALLASAPTTPAVATLVDRKQQVNYRLRRRNELFDLRRKLCDYSFCTALLGIVLMIVENEMTASIGHRQYKVSALSNSLKSSIVLSTIVLVTLIVMFHATEIKIFMSDNCCEDWRIAVEWRRVVQLSLEILVCTPCPFPGAFYFTWSTVHADGRTSTSAHVPLDVLFSIPMFLRLYLVCRVMLLHSKLVTDASSRSIGALNRLNFTARFVLKTLMTVSPGTILLCFTIVYWLTAAWIMRLCERWHDTDPPNVEVRKFQNYLNSLWLIAITSLTIGYGDVVPNTYCGRAVSVICGIMGAGTSSLVVAVVAKKLELSRDEKHVHNFMIDSHLSKQLKHAAANVLRETWFIYKNRKITDKIDAAKIRFHQRKFLVAIYKLRRVKQEQRKLSENSMTTSDIAKNCCSIYESISEMNSRQDLVDAKLNILEVQCSNLDGQLRSIGDLVVKMPELVARRLLNELSTVGSPSSCQGATDQQHMAGSMLSLNDIPHQRR